MSAITRKIGMVVGTVALMSVAAVAFVMSQSSLVATSSTDPPGDGVQLKIISVSVPADLKPEVTFSLADAKGSPLRLSDIDDGGLRFLMASIQSDPETKDTKYVNYVVNNVAGKDYQSGGKTAKAEIASTTQASVDSGGDFTDQGGGKFVYKFKTALTNYNPSDTQAVGGYVTRNSRAFVSNDALYFVPAGGPVDVQREVVTTNSCNACHDNLAAHGGTRRDTRLCVLCHTSQTADPETGNTVDFEVMIHKIHSGANLPSVEEGKPYTIVGYGQNKFDFSGVRWTQDTRNCQTCHSGAQGDNYKTRPSAAACSSCHDNVNFKTGENHPGGVQSDANCATCHQADGPEFGLSVAGAHTIPDKSKQLRGVNFEIVSFTDTKPGQSPTVVFNIKDNAGQPINPSEMANLAFVLSGPTTDYASPPVTETATGATATDDGNFSYTFKAKIPAEAKGTYAVGIQGYLTQVLKDASGNPVMASNGQPLQGRSVGFNKVAYGAVTDPQPMPRKQIVDIKNCNACHETLALHGGSRVDTEFCVLCHNSNNTDITKRTQANGPMPPVSISFGPLIHKIHTGEEQNDKLVVYGGSPSNPGPIDLSEAVFPTERTNCTKCHVQGSNLLSNMRKDLMPVTVKQGDTVVSSIPPIQANCTACHDSGPAITHAQAQTVNGKESCAVCHNEDRDFAVSKAHAR